MHLMSPKLSGTISLQLSLLEWASSQMRMIYPVYPFAPTCLGSYTTVLMVQPSLQAYCLPMYQLLLMVQHFVELYMDRAALFYGQLGDKLGRKRVCGMTLMLMVICSVGLPFFFFYFSCSHGGLTLRERDRESVCVNDSQDFFPNLFLSFFFSLFLSSWRHELFLDLQITINIVVVYFLLHLLLSLFICTMSHICLFNGSLNFQKGGRKSGAVGSTLVVMTNNRVYTEYNIASV